MNRRGTNQTTTKANGTKPAENGNVRATNKINDSTDTKIQRSRTPKLRDPKQGKVSQYSIHFTKRRQFEKERQKARQVELEKAQNQHYGEDSETDQKNVKRYGVLKSDSDDDDRFYSKKKMSRKNSMSSNGGQSPERSNLERKDSFVQTDPVEIKRDGRDSSPGTNPNTDSENDRSASRQSRRIKNVGSRISVRSNRSMSKYDRDTDPDTESDNGPIRKKGSSRRRYRRKGGYSSADTDPNTVSNDSSPGQSPIRKPTSRLNMKTSSAVSRTSAYERHDSPRYKDSWGFGKSRAQSAQSIRSNIQGRSSRMSNKSMSPSRGRKDSDGIDTDEENRKRRARYGRRKTQDPDTDHDGIDTEEENEKNRRNNSRFAKKKNDPDTDNDGVDTDKENENNKNFRTDSSKSGMLSSAEKRRRRMSYQPPRRNSFNSLGSKKPNSTSGGSRSPTPFSKSKTSSQRGSASSYNLRTQSNYNDQKSLKMSPADW